MDVLNEIKANFCCVKCRNKTFLEQELPLVRSRDKLIFSKGERFLVISCTLCGYSEMYNLKVLVQQPEKTKVQNPQPEPANGDLCSTANCQKK